MSGDPMAFVRTRLAEAARDIDESRALNSGDLHWSMPDWLDRDHLARWVAALRALAELHGPNGDPNDEWFGSDVRCTCCGGYDVVAGLGDRGYRMPWPCPTLRHIAGIWREHEAYMEEWR